MRHIRSRVTIAVAVAAVAGTMLVTPVAAGNGPNDNACEGQWAAFDAQYLAKVLGSSLGEIISASPGKGQDFRAVMHDLCEQLGMPPKFKDL